MCPTFIKKYREAIDTYYYKAFSKETVSVCLEALNTVYNRRFWHGYYLGQELGEWSDIPGSAATQKNVYVGKGTHISQKQK
ncbi:putative collagenase (Porphyromonas type) MEROPS family U32 [Flavobacterium aquidurense]|uniref:Putative collagenase (Porphyromonas type) MEROPS family U32 n=1 Tax=Flavobacterium aquidurense TaxID=362413 RepID=A0A0Q0S6L2_9FLAO|nr:putative collagenase (Porphyromonas type) MEROPS family U32 [Flavobacterium aquidurense]